VVRDLTGDIMTNSLTTRAELLRKAAEQARLAPSVHNTQPWRFVLTADALEIHSDRRRQLRILDPSGRQLTISCGCALFNIRVALAARGYDHVVERFPDPHRPDLLARVSPAAEPGAGLEIGMLDRYVISRQTNRRRFTDETVPPEVVSQLVDCAADEDAILFPIQAMDHRLAVARLSHEADAAENADPAYRAELRAWTSNDPGRQDGVPAVTVPRVTGNAQDDIPIRDFDTHGAGALPPETRSSLHHSLFLLGSSNDDPLSWVRTGEALERLWLVTAGKGYATSLFTQVIEIPYFRERLRAELGLSMRPHVLLRIGRAPITSSSMRRRLQDVLVDHTATSG
jgi:hypothetical protein